MSTSLDKRITSLSRSVDGKIREELHALLRTLREAHNATAVQLSMSRLALRLLTEILLRSGHGRPSDNLYDCICFAGRGDPHRRSKGLNVLPPELESYLHTIRVLSNKADHDIERISLNVSDAETSLGLYMRVLEWFYCEFDSGPRLPTMYTLSKERPEHALPRPSHDGKGLSIAVLYRRNTQPDDHVLGVLESKLGELGHHVFVDRHVGIGVDWARELGERIRGAHAVVPLLSSSSVQSEMMTCEVELAHTAQMQASAPRILPVRVNYEGSLPNELASIVGHLQYFQWRGPEDDATLVNFVNQSLASPPGRVLRSSQLESVGGAVPLDSQFYLVRDSDEEFLEAIARRDATVLIKGARQMGKSSLLARGLQSARESGHARVACTDLQKLSGEQMSSPERLLVALGEFLADDLGLDTGPAETWNDRISPNMNFERYLRSQILSAADRPLLWGLDEVDRLFSCDFGSEVFGLFRSWHNERALDPSGPWSQLTLAIAYATEAHLFITDLNQSPFNVGIRIALRDFSLAQVGEINRRYGSPLKTETELEKFFELIGGQPFLVRRGLHELSARNISLDEFEQKSDSGDGPFGDHLKRMLVLLAKDPDLSDVVREILNGRPCESPESFYRLRSAGILDGDSGKEARLRCHIYDRFFRRHLV